MANSQRVDADALRIGMLAGIFTRADAVTWADLMVAELDKPCGALIDLSMSEGMDGSSFSALLSAIPGEEDAALTKKVLLAKVRTKLASGEVADIVPCVAQLEDLVAFSDEEKAFAGRLASLSKADAQAFLDAYDVTGQTTLLG